MVDVPRQIEYWRAGSDEDLAAAESLLEKGHLRHSLFFCHLAIEKMLKAHVARQTNEIPPRIHNLVRLAEMAGLTLNAEQSRFLRSFDMYQMEGRYPDFAQISVDMKTAKEKLVLVQETLRWLKAQL